MNVIETDGEMELTLQSSRVNAVTCSIRWKRDRITRTTLTWVRKESLLVSHSRTPSRKKRNGRRQLETKRCQGRYARLTIERARTTETSEKDGIKHVA
jgi:hypothetical protein